MGRSSKSDIPEVLYDGSTGHPVLVSFDPGGVTGWALMKVHPFAFTEPVEYKVLDNIEHLELGQFVGSERSQVDQMIGLIESWPGCAIVCEDFILRTFIQDRSLLSPVRVNAAFSYAIGPEARLFLQQPSMAKSTMTDERLQEIGYYERTVGRQHARDALRHLFTFAMRIRQDPALLGRAFPALVS
jgi:hypothetical protein